MSDWPLGHFPDRFPKPDPPNSSGMGKFIAICFFVAALVCLSFEEGTAAVFLAAFGIITWRNNS
jgi:hypothetical protein